MSTLVTKTFQYGEHSVTLQTGVLARQADGAVLVSMGDTAVLVAVVGKREADESKGFFPLSVHYQERTYSAGKIPGGYFKREGRPTEKEILTSRLIDRPIRPLFPEGFKNDVQVVATVMSIDTEIDPDIPALIGASAALAISGMPFGGPIGAARVGYFDGKYVLNPPMSDIDESELNLVVAGTESAILMVESSAHELSEDVMFGALQFGHDQMQAPIQAIKALKEEAGKPSWNWEGPPANDALETAVKDAIFSQLGDAYLLRDKQERQDALKVIRDAVVEQLTGEEGQPTTKDVMKIVSAFEKSIVRDRVLNKEPRIDGRDTKTVRPITIDLGVLPRTHGSAVFTRGETQAVVVTTMGTTRDSQIIDALEGEYRDHFMLHYNFPPYCVGEVGMLTGPKRREIGHGKLAKRALAAVLPDEEEFPYVVRLVSEITESNGSSSMASVCGSSLALMDAGVPIKGQVAGIAMGLIKEGDRYSILTDILGDEDHLGDMDFKVAGTDKGITALQMDIKIDGITQGIMKEALAQAYDARVHILGLMNNVIDAPRESLSDYAPRIITINIPVNKIGDVIGKGGATIRALTEETGATVEIADDGLVRIASTDMEAGLEAQKRIENLIAEAEIGMEYDGEVIKIMDFGAFVRLDPLNQDGLVHISQIAEHRVADVNDELSEGQRVRVKVLDVDKQGRIKLSMKEVENKENMPAAQ